MTTGGKLRYKDGFDNRSLLTAVASDVPDDPGFVPLEERQPIEQARYFARKGMAEPEHTTGEFNRVVPNRSGRWTGE